MDQSLEVPQLKKAFEKRAIAFQFVTKEPVPFITGDSTLLFTNSTIVGLKNKIIKREVDSPGYSIIQPCIRNQNLKSIRLENENLEYMSCFIQAGILSHKRGLDNLLMFINDFLTVDMGLTEHDLIFKTSKKIQSINDSLSSIGLNISQCKVEMNTQPSGYYEWSYGLRDIKGIGATIAVRNRNLSQFLDIGNIIEIYDGEEILGYEFGFGIETLLSRVCSAPTPFECSFLFKDYQDVPKRWIYKFLDSLMVSSLLSSLDCNRETGKRASILRHAINDLCYLAQIVGVDIDKVRSSCELYSHYMLGVNDFPSNYLQESFKKIDRKIGLATEYARYCLRHKRGTAQFDEYCRSNGICLEFIRFIDPISELYDEICKFEECVLH